MADRVCLAVGPRRQAEIRVRQSQVLVIQRVEHLPTELQEALLGEMELLHQRGIDVPEAGRSQARQKRAGGSKPPPPIVIRVRVDPKALIVAVNRLKCRSVDPIGFLLDP